MRAIDRLILFQQSVKDVIGGQNKFESYTGLSTGYISNMKKNNGGISSDVMLKLREKFSDLNLDWLITGEGEMLKSSGSIIGSNQGEGNKIEYKNAGNVEFGNNINVTLPESGTQKIINPDGSIEIQQESSKIDISNEIQRLKLALHEKEIELAVAKEKLAGKEDIIKSKDETIALLKAMCKK